MEYREHASGLEMRFAGQILNLVGLVLLATAMLSYLRLTGLTQQAASSGILHTSLGLLLGGFLSWGGHQAHGCGLRSYAQPMLAVGFSLLLLTLGAAHFYFHLLPTAAFVVAVFGVVTLFGIGCIHYDSPLIALCLLGALYLGPTLMSFSMPLGFLCAYLMAINLATTAMAYRKCWDRFLVGSFFGTHGLYLSHFGLEHPVPTLLCLTVTYLLFLVSAQLFDRKQGEIHLWVSLANPLLFAFLSYAVLVRQPVSLAVGLFALLAAVHLLLYRRGMAQLNLSLAQLFALASTSFLTEYPVAVTALWLLQAFLALAASRKLPLGLEELARQGSYLAVGLAGFQLIYVVPTLETASVIQIPFALVMLGYFHFHTRPLASQEERLFSQLTFLLALAVASQTLLARPLYWSLAGAAVFSGLLQPLGRRYPVLQSWGRLGRPLAAMVAVGCWILRVPPLWLPGLALAIVPPAAEWSTVILMRWALWSDSWSTCLWCLLALGCLRWRPTVGALIFAATFLKAVAIDVDFAHGPTGWELASLSPWDLRLLGLVAGFWLGARLVRQTSLAEHRLREILLLYGQLVLVFQISRWLYDVYAILDNFQVILSAFWATTSLLFIGYGTYYGNRLFRLFGLALLVSCVVKMYAVDIWVLNAYDQTTTTLVMGLLLMLVSYFYQFNRHRLQQAAPQPEREELLEVA